MRIDLAEAAELYEADPGRAGGLDELEQHVLAEHAPAPACPPVDHLADYRDGDGEHDQARK
jgi:hypothetical protein